MVHCVSYQQKRAAFIFLRHICKLLILCYHYQYSFIWTHRHKQAAYTPDRCLRKFRCLPPLHSLILPLIINNSGYLNILWNSTAALGLFKSTRKSLWCQGFVVREKCLESPNNSLVTELNSSVTSVFKKHVCRRNYCSKLITVTVIKLLKRF